MNNHSSLLLSPSPIHDKWPPSPGDMHILGKNLSTNVKAISSKEALKEQHTLPWRFSKGVTDH